MKTWSLKEIINNMLDISTIDPERYVAHWRQTKWLVGSSLCIFVPGIYGYLNKEYVLSSVSIATGLCSINFWRDANYSWRRTIDCIMAKIAFITFTTIGPRKITKLSFLLAGWSGLGAGCMCYFMSNKYGDVETNELWWKYHMLFHICISFSQFITIKSIVDNSGLLLQTIQTI
jgi:hypothetical protein